MNENEQEVIDSQDDTETTENAGLEEVLETESTEAEPELIVDDEAEALRKEVETLKAQKEHWREKAEKKAAAAPAPAPAAPGQLSSKDLIALMKADVAEDDVDEVVDYAKFKKISIAEALKTSVIRTALEERREQRKTAEATTVGRTRSGNLKASDDTLLAKARRTGEIPDSQDDLDRMLEARFKS